MAAPKRLPMPSPGVPMDDPRWYAWFQSLERRNVGDPNVIDSLVVGEPTGDNKGLGSVNAEELYEDGLRVFVQRGNATAGLDHTPYAHGTKSSGTLTIDPLDGFFQTVTNGGAFTLSPVSSSFYGSVALHITNNGSAGTITRTGWTKAMLGDSLTTTNTHKFTVFMYFFGSLGADYLIKARQ